MAVLVFGGAFDPPHEEHVNMLRAAVSELGVKKAVIVPTFLPPHKDEGFLSFEDRCNLSYIAFKKIDAEINIDKIENERQTENYSSTILPLLKEKYGEIIFLIGGDSLMRMHEWYKPEDITACCKIAVIGRENYVDVDECIENLKASYGGDFIKLSYIGKDVSSSVIKAKLLLGLSVETIPDGVKVYIKSHKLFENYKPMTDKLRCIQSPELFSHSLNVVVRAIDLNSRHNLKLPFNKVFVAALLHDNAKERLSLDGLNVPADSIESPVLHQFLGAEKAKRDFAVADPEILNAIRYHTTAKADMTDLEKLIYTADSLSDDRVYEPIPVLRRVALVNFEKGFKSALKYTYLKVMAKGKGIYPLTAEAKAFYLDNKR